MKTLLKQSFSTNVYESRKKVLIMSQNQRLKKFLFAKTRKKSNEKSSKIERERQMINLREVILISTASSDKILT